MFIDSHSAAHFSRKAVALAGFAIKRVPPESLSLLDVSGRNEEDGGRVELFQKRKRASVVEIAVIEGQQNVFAVLREVLNQVPWGQKTVADAGEVREEAAEHRDGETLLGIEKATLRLLPADEEAVDQERQQRALFARGSQAKSGERLIQMMKEFFHSHSGLGCFENPDGCAGGCQQVRA